MKQCNKESLLQTHLALNVTQVSHAFDIPVALNWDILVACFSPDVDGVDGVVPRNEVELNIEPPGGWVVRMSQSISIACDELHSPSIDADSCWVVALPPFATGVCCFCRASRVTMTDSETEIVLSICVCSAGLTPSLGGFKILQILHASQLLAKPNIVIF